MLLDNENTKRPVVFMFLKRMIHCRTIWRWLGALSAVAAICLSPASLAGQEKAKIAQSGTGAVTDWQTRPISGFVLKEPPVVYTEPSFTNFLSQKLTPDEIALVNNPLLSTLEMNEWACKITAGTTNDLQKARKLFEEVVYRMRAGPGGTRTAQESFAAWKSPTATFCCQEYAELYVALARAAGLQAYFVEVIKQFGGATPRHACAAVLVNGQALLADPAIPWFGVAHPVINVTDDAEAIAEYMAQAPGLRQKAVAYKLAPELSAVQSGYYFGLTSEGQWDEAKKVLDAMPRWNTDEWVTNMAQGQWALHEGKTAVAVTVLQKAIQANSYIGVCRRMLGDALVQQGKLHEAREVYRASLHYVFDDFNAESVHEAISQINDLDADKTVAGADSSSQRGVRPQMDDAAVKVEVQEDENDAKAGDAFAMTLLARRYERGNGVEKDHLQARKWYQMAADAGNVESMVHLSYLNFYGKPDSNEIAQALMWCRKGAEAGNPEAMDNLGYMYSKGVGVPSAPVEAVRWFEKSANLGNAAGMSLLASRYHDGVGVEKDEAQALKWFRKAAEGGSEKAMEYLGVMYFFGQGIDKDLSQAAVWFRKGADAGNDEAMCNLGTMYLEGNGVAKDEAQAFHWYQSAANAGNVEGMNRVGQMYVNGVGVRKDFAKGLEWLHKAAEAGEPFAMFSLGLIYESGQGTKKDGAEAIRWYEIAEKSGSMAARQRLEVLTNHVKAPSSP